MTGKFDETYSGWEIFENEFGGWTAECSFEVGSINCWHKEEIYLAIDDFNKEFPEYS